MPYKYPLSDLKDLKITLFFYWRNYCIIQWNSLKSLENHSASFKHIFQIILSIFKRFLYFLSWCINKYFKISFLSCFVRFSWNLKRCSLIKCISWNNFVRTIMWFGCLVELSVLGCVGIIKIISFLFLNFRIWVSSNLKIIKYLV